MARRMLDELERLVRDMRGNAGDATARVSRDVETGSRRASRDLARLWSQVEDLFERNVARPAARATRAARPYARTYAREGREMTRDAAYRLRSATRSHPLLAIGIAIAATFLVTSALQGRRSGRDEA